MTSKIFQTLFPVKYFFISKHNKVNAWSCPLVACSFNDYGAVGECKENIIQLCVNISNASIESSIQSFNENNKLITLRLCRERRVWADNDQGRSSGSEISL